MEKSVKLMRTSLNITGFDVLKGSDSFGHRTRRWIFFIAILNIICCFFYTIFTDKNLECSGLILLSTSTMVYVSILTQTALFWAKREKTACILKIIKGFHWKREEEWVNEYSLPLYEKCANYCYKICKQEFFFNIFVKNT